MSVREGFFDDEGVGGVVVERVANGGGFGGALCGVVVAGRLDDAAEFAVGGCEAGLGFLDVELVELDAEVGFSETETWEMGLIGVAGRKKGGGRVVTSSGFDYSIDLLSCFHCTEVELLDYWPGFVEFGGIVGWRRELLDYFSPHAGRWLLHSHHWTVS